MIGWYIHHHGLGHQRRFNSIRPLLDTPVRAFSSSPSTGVTQLPLDTPAPRSHACAAVTDSQGYHYAPLGVAGVRKRMATMAAWINQAQPELFVIDVSVEVAALTRLLSVPTVVMRQHGHRNDAPHLQCYANAVALLAPFSEELESPHTSGWVRDKTIYAGGFSRFDGRAAVGEGTSRALAREQLGLGPQEDGRRTVVVLDGRGGEVAWPVAAAAAATPGWEWKVLGCPDAGGHGIGWVEDPWLWLRTADVIIAHAGHNAVMECAASSRPTVVIPQDRPFSEQHDKALVLHSTGSFVVRDTWPEPHEWLSVLDEALTVDTGGLNKIVDGAGAARAASALRRLAESFARPGGSMHASPACGRAQRDFQ